MKDSTEAICPHCGAENSGDATLCWLCQDAVDTTRTYAGPKPPVRIHPKTQGATFSLSSAMLTITLLCVFFGMLVIGPGLAIPMAIVSVPVFVRTAWVVRKRRERGLGVSPARKVALFVGSFVTTTVMLVVVGVSAVGTFCGICVGLASGSSRSRPGSEAEMIFVSAISAIGVVSLIAILLFKWARARWRRDTSR